MRINWSLVLSIALAGFASSQELPGTPEQRDKFVQHMQQLKDKYQNSPEATSLAREIQPYITAVNYAQATALVEQFQAANIPQNAEQFSTWASNPLVFATAGPQPQYVQKMPSDVREKYLHAQYDQMKEAASIARKDFQINAASSMMPASGWVMGAAGGVAAAVALFL